MDYSRGPEKTWVYGALRVHDGKELTRCAASRNSTNYVALLEEIEAGNPIGDIFMITDNLSSHNSAQTRAWMAEHPRLHHVFIPIVRFATSLLVAVAYPLWNTGRMMLHMFCNAYGHSLLRTLRESRGKRQGAYDSLLHASKIRQQSRCGYAPERGNGIDTYKGREFL